MGLQNFVLDEKHAENTAATWSLQKGTGVSKYFKVTLIILFPL
jgi:hypothetical protein